MAGNPPFASGHVPTALEINNISTLIDTLAFGSVTNLNTEQIIGTFANGIPANDAGVNSGYEFSLTFNYDCTGTPTLRFRLYVASIATTNLIFDSASLNLSATHTFQSGGLKAWMICTVQGAAGQFDSYGFGQFNNTSQGFQSYSQTQHVINTTVSNAVIFTAQYGTANAANTARTTGGTMRRS